MTGELGSAISVLTNRVVSLAAEDQEIRSALRTVGHAVSDMLGRLEGAEAAPVMAPLNTDCSSPTEVYIQPAKQAPEAIQELPSENGLNGSGGVDDSQDIDAAEDARLKRPSRSAPPTDDELPMIESRCRLKAEGSRWSAERLRLRAAGAVHHAEIAPRDRDIMTKSKALPDCRLWMNRANSPVPSDLSLLDNLGGCFEALATAVAVVPDAMAGPSTDGSTLGQALALAAEAQSAVRCAVMQVSARADYDQTLVFKWLRDKAEREQLFIQRFMRADDQADPASWPDVLARIELLRGVVEAQKERQKRRTKMLGKVRYLLDTLDRNHDEAKQWREIAATLDELVRSGVPPSSLDIREVMLPYVQSLPSCVDMPQGFQLVVRELERFLAGQGADEPPSRNEGPIEAVREVARKLRGKSLVLIGGDCRPNAHEALKRDFALSDLYWIETRPGQSVYSFEPYVARADVAAVLLAIRWSSHGFGDVSRFCTKYGKPLVRLPGGYSPNQVAAKLMEHCPHWFHKRDGAERLPGRASAAVDQ